MRPKTLVVPLDGSEFAERALPIATTLAERLDAGLLLVSAEHQGPLDPRAYLDEQVARLSPHRPAAFVTSESDAAAAITEAVSGGDDLVVCMTTHGRGRLRWAALGSVAENVIRLADRPMILVGRHCRTDFLERSTHLLACADGGEGSAELGTATREWSQLLGLDLHVAVVVHPLDVESAEHPNSLLDPLAAEFGDATRATTRLVRSGYPAGALADVADELPAALVAMSCRAREGLARFALGSVTMGVLHLAPCPLLVTHQDIEIDSRP